jgi:hypothetical protein
MYTGKVHRLDPRFSRDKILTVTYEDRLDLIALICGTEHWLMIAQAVQRYVVPVLS